MVFLGARAAWCLFCWFKWQRVPPKKLSCRITFPDTKAFHWELLCSSGSPALLMTVLGECPISSAAEMIPITSSQVALVSKVTKPLGLLFFFSHPIYKPSDRYTLVALTAMAKVRKKKKISHSKEGKKVQKNCKEMGLAQKVSP